MSDLIISKKIKEENTKRIQSILDYLRIKPEDVKVDNSIKSSRQSGTGNIQQQGQTNVCIKLEYLQEKISEIYVINSNDDFGKKIYMNPETDQLI